jgi:hypothetical protein
MRLLSDPRRKSIALLAAGVLLFFALLGVLQAFNIRILNPVTTGETLVFTGLTVVVFLPKQQRAGGATSHADGSGSHVDCADARGVHVPVQLLVDEPVD